MDDVFEDDEPVEETLPSWRAPVACPRCQNTETQFLTLHFEASVYACERCGIEFEIEE